MGQCACQKSRKPRACELVPEDIMDFDPERVRLQKLQFEGNLCNIRVQNCPDKNVSIRFEMEDIIKLQLPFKSPISGCSELKWKEFTKFSMVYTEYHLRKIFLKIQAIDEKGNQLASTKVNLYYIVNGPYHHDFGIKLGKVECRLIFDLKIAQVVKINFQPQSVQVSLHNQYPRQQFNYSFKILQHNNTGSCLQSELSSSRPVTLGRKSFDLLKPEYSKENQCHSPLRAGKKSSKLQRTPSLVNWSFEQNPQMSSFNLSMNAAGLMKASVEFVLWKLQSVESQEETCRLFADCYFPFTKLFEKEGSINMKTQEVERTVNFSEHLLINGKTVGEVRFTIKISHKQFFKQPKACARTQDGVVNMTRQFNSYNAKKSSQTQNRFIDKLQYSQRTIQEKNVEMSNLNFKVGYYGKATQQKDQIHRCFEEMLETLKTTHNQFSTFTTLKEKQNIFEEQEKLLRIVQKLYPFIQDQDVAFAKICWTVIVKILKRGVFSLNNMCFTEEEAQQIQKKCESIYLARKIKVSINYQRLLNKILILSLSPSYSDYHRESSSMADVYKAYCYVHSSIFRSVVLNAISKQQDLLASQWKFPTLPTSELMTYDQTKKFFYQSFDWQTHFYKPLACHPESNKLNEELTQNLGDHDWLRLISDRKDQYFFFTEQLMIKLDDLCKKAMFDKWHHIPGYNMVVRSFLYQLKRLSIPQYPNSLQLASMAMLANQKLLNIFLTILARKTNSFDQPSVVRTLELLSLYFHSHIVIKNKCHLPLTFDYLFFFEVIKMVLENSFTFSTCKALNLIFDFYNNFSQEFKRLLIRYLLGKAFFRLFLHWSYPVRKMFHHLLVMRVGEDMNSTDEELPKTQRILEAQKQYDYVIGLLRKAEEAKKKEEKQSLLKNNERQLYKVMKKKLAKKKQKMPLYNRRSQLNNLFTEMSEQQESDRRSPRKRSETVTNGMPPGTNFRLSELQAQQDSNSCDFTLTLRHSDSTTKTPVKDKDSGSSKYNSNQISIGSYNNQSCRLENTQYSSEKNSNNETEKSEEGSRRRKFSIVSEQNFQLCEIQHSQQVYICVALEQFRDITAKVKKHLDETGKLPTVDFQFEIAIDEKEIRPSVADKLQR